MRRNANLIFKLNAMINRIIFWFYDSDHIELFRLILFVFLIISRGSGKIFADEFRLGSSETVRSEWKRLLSKSTSSVEIGGKYLTRLDLIGDVEKCSESGKRVSVVQTFDQTSFMNSPRGVPAENWKWSEDKTDSLFSVIDNRLVIWTSPLQDKWVLGISSSPATVASFEENFNSLFEKAGPASLMAQQNNPLIVKLNSQNIFQDKPLHVEKGKALYLRVSLKKDITWKHPSLKLESSPPLLWKAISNSKGSPAFQEGPLEVKPHPLFGDLREGKVWLIIIEVAEPKGELYHWSYKFSSDEPPIDGDFQVHFE
jgi:hypothetical protein